MGLQKRTETSKHLKTSNKKKEIKGWFGGWSGGGKRIRGKTRKTYQGRVENDQKGEFTEGGSDPKRNRKKKTRRKTEKKTIEPTGVMEKITTGVKKESPSSKASK